MLRSNAREIAVHLVFAMDFSTETPEALLQQRMDPEYYDALGKISEIYAERPNSKQLQYIQSLVLGVADRRAELEGYIEKYSIGWKLTRISKIAKAILEVAMYEALHVEDVPVGVAINEAVTLCKKYEEAETAAFVNGILGRFSKEVTDDVSGT